MTYVEPAGIARRCKARPLTRSRLTAGKERVPASSPFAPQKLRFSYATFAERKATFKERGNKSVSVCHAQHDLRYSWDDVGTFGDDGDAAIFARCH